MRAKYLLPCCCILDSLLFDMQHEIVLKKINFDILTPRLEGGGGLRRERGQNICTILLHLCSCNMIMV